MKQHYNYVVTGKVQGVFFRKYTKEKADELGIKGIVKNQSDGSVYIEAEGRSDILNDFERWCNQGPDRAKVSDLKKTEGDLKDYKDFSIQY